jgi:hypothetical protein
MLLNDDIQKTIVQMILHFQKEIIVIMYIIECRNPTLRQMWGWNSHSQKWELGVLRDSQKLRAWLQG